MGSKSAESLNRNHPRLPLRRTPLAYLLVYRSAVLAGDTQAIEALADALVERGIDPLVLAVSSLKDPEAVAVVRRAIRARRPDVIVTTTAFSARDDADFVLDEADCPILQAIPVGSAREAWEASPRGLSAADLAMQVALPEFDGRIAAGPISFKAEEPADPALAFSRRVQAPMRPASTPWPIRPPPGCVSPARRGASDGWRSCCPITRPAADGPASRSGSTRRRAPARSSMRSRRPATTAATGFHRR